MNEIFTTPGSHALWMQGLVGKLEAILSVPAEAHPHLIALLGHPHSLQGGTMNNKVVTTLARTFNELKITNLRLNFRGVGESAGSYDEGIGESEDMLAIVQQLKEKNPALQFIFAGFSFGSYVTYRVAAQHEHRLLLSVAPAVHHYDYLAFDPSPAPWIVVQGTEDEVVPASLVFDFINKANSPIRLLEFAETTHFFHGKLIELKSRLIATIPSFIGIP